MTDFINAPVVRERNGSARRMREGKYAVFFADLEAQCDEAERQAEDLASREPGSDTAEAAKIHAEAHKKRLEIFEEEHDATGAWKVDRFRDDVAKEARRRSWERNKEGFKITPEDERSHILLINMGELDRLNSSGDHSLGDKGLRLTAERIESIAREVLRDDFSRYEIYRYSGNDFALSLKDVDIDLANEIQKRLAQEPISLERVKPGEEDVPVTASRVSRSEGLDLLNRLDEQPEDAGLTNEGVLIQAMIEKAQTLNDIAKFESRAHRMAKKLEESPITAADFYEKFLKKSLGNVFKSETETGPAGFESFRRILEEKRASHDPHSWPHFVTERAMDEAFEGLKARRAVGRSIDLAIAKNVAKTVLSREGAIGSIAEADEHAPSSPDFSEPKPTSGMLTLEMLQNRAEEAASHREESKKAEASAELASVEVDLETAKRESRTGLYGRGMFFKTLNGAFAEGVPVSTIAIDMAFLKYFDKEGGPETGNLAIRKTAEILDGIAQDFRKRGVQVEAYRMGGDEFSISITGADEKTLQEVLITMRKAQDAAGRVPARAGARSGYVSEGLQFNYGLRHAPDAATFRRELQGAGILLQSPEGSAEESKELSDLLVRLADKEVELQKGVNRIMLLTQRTVESIETRDPRNLEMLKVYSQKAIFGDAGVAKIDAFSSRLISSKDRESELRRVRVEALEFVLAQIEQKNTDAAHLGHSLDRHLEDAVLVRYFKQRVSELEEEVELLQERITRERGSSEHLRQAVAAAEEEKRAVVRLRERMYESPPTLRTPTTRKAA